jgi:hypothetical protein
MSFVSYLYVGKKCTNNHRVDGRKVGIFLNDGINVSKEQEEVFSAIFLAG